MKKVKVIIDADSMIHRIAYLVNDIPFDSIEGDTVAPDGVHGKEEVIREQIEQQIDMYRKDILKEKGLKPEDLDIELHLTASSRFSTYYKKKYNKEPREGFRYAIARKYLDKAYKHNRPDAKKQYLEESFEVMLNHFKSEAHDFFEADDTVIAKAKYYRRLGHDVVIAAIDKDVLMQIEGNHYNWGKRKFEYTDENTAIFYAYLQCLTGDQIDGYTGIPGIGETRARDIIDESMNEEEMWQSVLNAYNRADMGEAQALATMRLANMHQCKCYDRGSTYKLFLWRPPMQRNNSIFIHGDTILTFEDGAYLHE